MMLIGHSIPWPTVATCKLLEKMELQFATPLRHIQAPRSMRSSSIHSGEMSRFLSASPLRHIRGASQQRTWQDERDDKLQHNSTYICSLGSSSISCGVASHCNFFGALVGVIAGHTGEHSVSFSSTGEHFAHFSCRASALFKSHLP